MYILLSIPSIFWCDHVHCTRFQKEWAELHEASRECAAKAQVCNLDCLCTVHVHLSCKMSLSHSLGGKWPHSKDVWDKLFWTLSLFPSWVQILWAGKGRIWTVPGLMAPLHFCGFIHFIYMLNCTVLRASELWEQLARSEVNIHTCKLEFIHFWQISNLAFKINIFTIIAAEILAGSFG